MTWGPTGLGCTWDLFRNVQSGSSPDPELAFLTRFPVVGMHIDVSGAVLEGIIHKFNYKTGHLRSVAE